ncbi:MAG TPA: TolC family protein [Hanamia sp.]|nr:TolC family protein [Hanamia sp.]
MLVSAYYKKSKILLFVLLLIGTSQVSFAQIWTLEQCIDSAQVYNKNLQIQRNNIEIGNQKQEEVKGNLLPKVNANADYKYFTNLPYQFMPMALFGGPDGKYKEVQFGVPHNINANLQLTLPLYNPQIKGAIQSTEIATELTKLQLKKSEEQIYFEISNLYYNAQILNHQILFIDSNLVNANRLLRTMQLLKEQLMAKGTDVNKVALQADQLKTQKAIIESKLEQVMQALKFSMGISPDREIEISHDIIYQHAGSYTRIPTLDFQIAATQNRLLNSELNTLKKSSLPTVALFGTYGVNGFGYDKKPDNFLKFHSVGFAGVQLTYNLFDGNVLRKKQVQKKMEIQNNELQQALVTEQNTMQIGNALNQRNTAQKSIMLTEKQIQQAQSIYEQTIMQQKEGVASLNDVLAADNALREVQQSYISAVVDYLKADLELKKVSGQLRIKN